MGLCASTAADEKAAVLASNDQQSNGSTGVPVKKQPSTQMVAPVNTQTQQQQQFTSAVPQGTGSEKKASQPQVQATPAAAPAATATTTSEDRERGASEWVRNIRPDAALGEHLRRVPLLSKLTTEEREKLGGVLVEAKFADGQTVFDQGTAGDGFYIIKEGNAVVTHSHQDTRQMNELARLGPGDYFGETALLTNAPRGASVNAVGPLTCWFLSKAKFKALFTEDRLNVQFAKRRIAISAEAGHVDVKSRPISASHVEMSAGTRRLVLHAVEGNVLFEGLDAEHKKKIVDEMYQIRIARGETAIKEGEPGNNLYVIESGTFDILVKDEVSGRNTKVAERGPGTIFGELALLYNAPRAASVLATSDAVLWVVDRYTFRRIAQDVGESRLKHYTDFLQGVDLLHPLAEYEREKIAEAVEEVSFAPGEVIFHEGREGDAMYFVAEGEVIVTQRKMGEDGKETLVTLNQHRKGDYFGEKALLERTLRAGTVTAVDRVHLYKLDISAFKLLLGPVEDIMKSRLAGYEAKARVDDDELTTELKSDIKQTDLKPIGVLGKGSFGTVMLVALKNDPSKTFALKSVWKQQIVETRQQGHVMSEKKVMIALIHPFIIRLYATYKDQHKLFFLLEPSLGGELFTVLRKNRLFPESTGRFYAASVLLAFEYMHSKNIVYRDLKPENLLLDQDGYLKVTDFGFAKKIKAKTWTLCGTPEYLAPEIVGGKGHGKGVDWWTLGILIFEMLASYTPFYHEDHMKMYQKITKGRINFPAHFSPEAKSLISGLLTVDPTKRYGVIHGGASTIKAHPWFKGFSFDDLLNRRIKGPIIPKLRGNNDLSNFDDYSQLKEDLRPYVDDGSNWDRDF